MMALAFKDIAAGYTGVPTADTILGLAHLPALTPAQGAMVQSWMATASSISGAALTPAQINRLVLFWAYCLGVSAPQIVIYAADNM
jgi:hypothetical protein